MHKCVQDSILGVGTGDGVWPLGGTGGFSPVSPRSKVIETPRSVQNASFFVSFITFIFNRWEIITMYAVFLFSIVFYLLVLMGLRRTNTVWVI